MGSGAGAWQRSLLSSGLLEPGEGRRTVRDWVVDAVVFGAALASGIFVLASTWEQHSTAIAVPTSRSGVSPAQRCGFAARTHWASRCWR